MWRLNECQVPVVRIATLQCIRDLTGFTFTVILQYFYDTTTSNVCRYLYISGIYSYGLGLVTTNNLHELSLFLDYFFYGIKLYREYVDRIDASRCRCTYKSIQV